jgi:hypothetical protein
MKHLLNDLTEQEKNSIREQHTGGMVVLSAKFSKLVNTKLGDAKPLVNEQAEEQDMSRFDTHVKTLESKGYKVVDKISLPDGEYDLTGGGYICYLVKDNKDTGYAFVTTGGIRGPWDGHKVNVVGGKIEKVRYGQVYKMLYNKSVVGQPTVGF